MNSRRQTEHQIMQLLSPSMEALGLQLVAAELRTIEGQYTLRVSIDKPGGVGIQDCTLASREISPLLDVEDPVDRPYHLQVSSPGIDRPLQRLEDFSRFEGLTAKILLQEGPPRRRYRGVLRGCDGDHFLIEVDGEITQLEWDLLDRAHLVLTLEEYQQLAAPSVE